MSGKDGLFINSLFEKYILLFMLNGTFQQLLCSKFFYYFNFNFSCNNYNGIYMKYFRTVKLKDSEKVIPFAKYVRIFDYDNICCDNTILKRHCVHRPRSILQLVIAAAVQEIQEIILNRTSIVAHRNS